MRKKVIFDIFGKSTVYLRYVDWRRRILAACRGSEEAASRTFIGVETSSSFQVAWSHRNERELFSTRRKVNNRCTTNICSEFYFSSLSLSLLYNFWGASLTIRKVKIDKYALFAFVLHFKMLYWSKSTCTVGLAFRVEILLILFRVVSREWNIWFWVSCFFPFFGCFACGIIPFTSPRQCGRTTIKSHWYSEGFEIKRRRKFTSCARSSYRCHMFAFS